MLAGSWRRKEKYLSKYQKPKKAEMASIWPGYFTAGGSVSAKAGLAAKVMSCS